MHVRTASMAIALTAILAFTASDAEAAEGREITATGSMRSVRKALRKAKPGDTVVIAPGTYRGRIVIRRPNITVRAEGAVLRTKKPGKKAVVIRGSGSSVSGLTIEAGRIVVDADAVTLRDLQLRGVEGRTAVEVQGDEALVEDSRFEAVSLDGKAEAVVAVTGDRAVLRGNFADALIDPDGIATGSGDRAFLRIDGHDALVRRNRLELGVGITGVSVTGDRAQVDDNNLRWTSTGIVVSGASADVHGNGIDDGQGVAVDVTGDDATVTANSARGRAGDGLRVRGDGFRITDNTVHMGAFTTTPPAAVANGFAAPAPNGQVPVYDPTVAQGGTPGCPAVVADGRAGAIEDNTIVFAMGTGISMRTFATEIRGNLLVLTSREAGTGILVERGDGNVVESNEITATNFANTITIDVRGSENTVRDNTVDASYYFSLRGIAVKGRRNIIENNALPGVHAEAVTASGGENAVVGNVVENPAIGLTGNQNLSRRPLFEVSDDDNRVEQNTVVLTEGRDWSNGLVSIVAVRGSRNRISENLVDGIARFGTPKVTSVYVSGDANEIEANDIRDCGNRAVVVGGDENVVDGNRAENTIAPHDDSSWIGSSFKSAILVIGNGNEVCANETEGAWDTGIIVRGSDCDVLDNEVQDSGEHGFDIEGEGHVLCENRSVAATATGFSIPHGSDITVERCLATGSGACGIETAADRTSIVGSTFTGSGVHDVHVTGTLETFEGNIFDTLVQ